VNSSDIEQLVKASQRAERGAFDELVRLHQWRATKAAVKVLGDVNEAAEAVQQGFLTAYLKIGKLRDASRFDAWLLKIVANAAISRRRAAKRKFERIRITEGYEDKNVVGPVENSTALELKEAIQRAMLKLSAKEARAIALFGLEDLSQKQVAQIMDCSVEAVRYHVYKARGKLKVLLKEYLE
jgi:RNA polymerase sigma-70 factor (ECF subfamily)